MTARSTFNWARAVLALPLALSTSLPAQESRKKVVVLTFDQQAVSGGLKDVFGQDNVDVGRGLARLIAHRLGEGGGFEVVEAPGAVPFTTDPSAAAAAGKAAGADAVIAGSVLVYGSGSSTTGVNVGPRIGGLGLGIGRRTTVAVVQLEARLIDVASGTLLGVVPGQANASKSGTALYVKVPNLISADGQIDMTREEFSKTLIGDVTNQAVLMITRDVLGMRGRIGQTAAVAPVAAPAMAVPAPVSVPVGPVVYPTGPFAWTPYQFRGSEHFRYDVSKIEDGKTETGFYQLDLEPAGQGQVRMKVQGKIGTEEYSSTTTVPVAGQQQGPVMGMGFGQLMSLGPIGIMLFNPAAWMVFYGHQLSVGDGWSSSSGGETMSVKVERTCDHAGQGGLMTILRENNQIRQESCVSPSVALPLRVMTDDGSGTKMEMVLVGYRP